MATFRTSQFHDGVEDVRALKDASENLNTRNSTSRRILTGILSKNSENSELKPYLNSKLLRACVILDRYDKARKNMSKPSVIRHP